VISSSQNQLPVQHTSNTGLEHPCPQRDSNAQSEISICSDPRLRPHSHRYWRSILVLYRIWCFGTNKLHFWEPFTFSRLGFLTQFLACAVLYTSTETFVSLKLYI